MISNGAMRLDVHRLRVGAGGIVRLVLADPSAFLAALEDGSGEGELRIRGARIGTEEGKVLAVVTPRPFRPLLGVSVVEHLVLAIRLARRLRGVRVPPLGEVLEACGLAERAGVLGERLTAAECDRLSLAIGLVRPAFARFLWIEAGEVSTSALDRILMLHADAGGASVVLGRSPALVAQAETYVQQGSQLVRDTSVRRRDP